MENYHLYDELLTKYLANEVTAEERELAIKWIDASQKNKRYFEQLKHIWQLFSVKHPLVSGLDEINVNEQWDRFKEGITEKGIRQHGQHESE